MLHGSSTLPGLVGFKNCNQVMHVAQCAEQGSDEILQYHASAMGHAASWYTYSQAACCNLRQALALPGACTHTGTIYATVALYMHHQLCCYSSCVLLCSSPVHTLVKSASWSDPTLVVLSVDYTYHSSQHQSHMHAHGMAWHGHAYVTLTQTAVVCIINRQHD